MENIPYCRNKLKSKNNFQEAIEFLRIINEPNRLRIIYFLNYGEQCVCNIRKSLNISQNLTSYHLKTLKDFGLVDSRQEGKKIIYSSNKKFMKKCISLLNNFLILNL